MEITCIEPLSCYLTNKMSIRIKKQEIRLRIRLSFEKTTVAMTKELRNTKMTRGERKGLAATSRWTG